MIKVLAALALGLATGLLVGMSVSEVVAAVLSSLIAIATSLAALGQAKLLPGVKSQETSAADHLVILFFALALICGVVAGVQVRTHDLLSPTPSEVSARWQTAGFDKETANRIALQQLRGIDIGPNGVKTSVAAEPSASQSILFSGDLAGTCVSADPERAPSLEEVSNTWMLSEQPWPMLADVLEGAPLSQYNDVWSALCD